MTQVYFCEFCQIFKNTFFTEHLRATTSAKESRILMLSKYVWDNIAQENYLCNIGPEHNFVLVCLGQDCTKQYLVHCRNSYQRCFVKKGVLKNFAIFTGKHMCWSFFLIKLRAFRTATLLKKNSSTDVLEWNLRNF